MKVQLIIYMSLVIMGWAWIVAQAEPVLKLDDLIDQALHENPSKEVAEQDALAQKGQIGPSGAYEDPMLSFTAKDYPVDTYSRRQYGMTGNEVSLTQRVPFPGKLSQRRSEMRNEFKSKDAQAHFKKMQIIRDVKRSFYEHALAYKQREIVLEQKNLVHQLVTVSRARYSTGKIGQVDLLNLQTEELLLLEKAIESEKEIATTRAELAYVMGRKDGEIQGKPEMIRKTPFDYSARWESHVFDLALRQNPMIKMAIAQIDASKDRLTGAKLSWLPDFELMGAYTFRAPSPGDRGVDFVSAKVGMTVPLWFLSKQIEEVKSAKAQQYKFEAQLQDSQNELRQKTKSAYEELKESDRRLEIYDTGILPLVRQAVQSGKSSYLSGRLEYLNLVAILQNRFKTEFSYQELLVAHEAKIADLELLMGEEIVGGK